MPKTYPWSTIVPSGTDQASTADDHIRRLRLEIEERMNDIVEDWSADPVVLQASPTLLGTKLNIHCSAFVSENTDSVAYGDNNLEITAGAEPLRAPVILRAGLAVTRFRALVTHPGGGGDIVVSFKTLLLDPTLPNAVEISRLTTATEGQHMLDSAALAFTHTVDENEALFIVFDTGSVTAKLHWVELTYTQESE